MLREFIVFPRREQSRRPALPGLQATPGPMRRHRCVIYVLQLVNILILCPVLQAQQTPIVAVGSRVRFSPADSARPKIAGVVTGRLGDILLIRTDDQDTLYVPRTQFDRLEVSRGVHGHALKGLAMGIITGAAIGGAFGAAAGSNDYLGPGAGILLLGAAGAGGGAVIGLVVGALIRSERWKSLTSINAERPTPDLERDEGYRRAVAWH